MTRDSTGQLPTGPYGPIGFSVAILHVLVVSLATWLFALPLPLFAVVVLPITLSYLAICWLIARGPGTIGQIGRGMLFGTLSGPLSLVIFIPGFVIAHAIGPL